MRTRAALTIAGTALVLGSLTGCGSSDDGGDAAGPPDDASLEDFCTTFSSLTSNLLGGGGSDGSASSIKDWAADLEKVGTPSEMPADARDGFEILIEQASKIDGDASLQDLQQLEKDVSKKDAEKALAFSTWAVKECPNPLSDKLDDLPSELPSDLPTELPSDLASQLEELSDLPSDLASQLEELQESAGS